MDPQQPVLQQHTAAQRIIAQNSAAQRSTAQAVGKPASIGKLGPKQDFAKWDKIQSYLHAPLPDNSLLATRCWVTKFLRDGPCHTSAQWTMYVLFTTCIHCTN